MADRCRFQRRVQLVEEVLKKYLTVDYRQTVFTEGSKCKLLKWRYVCDMYKSSKK
ncbi:unnamed protein product [Acanthoscelides obtectus]|uniref:Uncharacterized protein n=1 Tax=Acanthoscelides obtectus TaxID=200917 RepID=A0A9P0VVA4_ACAOB|nr:unnamed protein product [Acanthoscelides obtectus]CAK1686915.1 hypothetical protein AOBTE_LOCUS36148 [Acanthoscelides obtectus]